MKSHHDLLVERDVKIAEITARQRDVSDLVGKTIVQAEISDGTLKLLFNDGSACSFEGEGAYNPIDEDVETEVVRVLENNV